MIMNFCQESNFVEVVIVANNEKVTQLGNILMCRLLFSVALRKEGSFQCQVSLRSIVTFTDHG